MLNERVNETVKYIKSQTDQRPVIALILGSGLGSFAEKLENKCVLPYEEIPNFVVSTAPGHEGRMVIGEIDSKTVLCMQGRCHLYEGYSMQEITYPIRVLERMGIEKLIITNSAGGINPEFEVGDLMLIEDHINFMGDNPLIGQNEEEFGVRFPDMTFAYDEELRILTQELAEEVNIPLQKGVYLGVSGPSFETPAEIKAFRFMGASATGMSTVPEVIVTNHCGIRVLGISCITNLAAGILDQPLTSEEVFETTSRTAEKFKELIETIIKHI